MSSQRESPGQVKRDKDLEGGTNWRMAFLSGAASDGPCHVWVWRGKDSAGLSPIFDDTDGIHDPRGISIHWRSPSCDASGIGLAQVCDMVSEAALVHQNNQPNTSLSDEELNRGFRGRARSGRSRGTPRRGFDTKVRTWCAELHHDIDYIGNPNV